MAARESKHQTWQRRLIRGGRAVGAMAPALPRHLSYVLVKLDTPQTANRVCRGTGPTHTMRGPRDHA